MIELKTIGNEVTVLDINGPADDKKSDTINNVLRNEPTNESKPLTPKSPEVDFPENHIILAEYQGIRKQM